LGWNFQHSYTNDIISVEAAKVLCSIDTPQNLWLPSAKHRVVGATLGQVFDFCWYPSVWKFEKVF
jgi:hypothetical protein